MIILPGIECCSVFGFFLLKEQENEKNKECKKQGVSIDWSMHSTVKHDNSTCGRIKHG